MHITRRLFPALLFGTLALAAHLPAFAADASQTAPQPPDGFVALFNGQDLSGWKGLVASPAARAAMSPEQLAAAQQQADEQMRAHWKVVDGALAFDGKGASLCTVEDYGDFEMYVDWKISPGGDSGIYLRGSPQVQLWDTEYEPYFRHGADKGSGALWNNQNNPRFPLVKADKPAGQWNTLYVKMVGDRVTVKLNGQLVTDNVVMENVWERDKPIYPSGQIELQNHGNPLWFRNIYLRQLDSDQAAEASQPVAISPKDEPIKLFNGENLDGFYTYIEDTGHEDPRQVFTVKDGLLHISGDGWGGLITEQTYRDYHLVIEFKWGERTWDSRKDRARDSGVLVHCFGPDGGFGGRWMASVEAQIIEGGVGDILVLSGKDPQTGEPLPVSLTTEITRDRDGERVWKKGGERVTLSSGRINWWGRDEDWSDTIDFRGKQDVESEFGQWTRMDVICEGDHLLIKVNGVTVNEASDIQPSEGKILLQTELAEMFVRRYELWPLGQAPEAKPAPAATAQQ